MATSELTMAGVHLGELLQKTRDAFLRALEPRKLSPDYLRQSRFIIDEFARFCQGEGDCRPWQLRQRYLASRAALRSEHPFSASYLEGHGRELGRFLRWYERRVAAGEVCLGELSAEQRSAYWSTQKGALPYRHRIVTKHLPGLLAFLSRRCEAEPSSSLVSLLDEYFEERRLQLRGEGYGFVLSHRARIVTRRHLIWLERQGHLPAGTAAAGNAAAAWQEVGGMAAENGEGSPAALLRYFTARVDPGLPQGLRRPLLEYLEHLVYECGLVKSSIHTILRTNQALCHLLAEHGINSFGRLRVGQLDEVVSSLVSAPPDDLLRRRQQVQQRNSELRGFLRALKRQGLLRQDLAAALISPPCYRVGAPTKVLSEKQMQTLLDSVDRAHVKGLRGHAIVLLITTYGLRPVDIARLRLEALHWREERIALVQSKTGRALALPLLPEVAEALWAYLRAHRVPGLAQRQVFLSLNWPHRPLRRQAISCLVKEALREAGIAWASAHHLRASVATHLLRQGEALSTIQDILGQRTADTTQRYAVTDPQLLRQVLEESER